MSTHITTDSGAGPGRTSTRWGRVSASPATALTAIWLTVTLTALFAPDMVTGSEHEHLPMAAMTVWIWAGAASLFVVLGARRVESPPSLVLGTSGAWLVVMVAVLTVPSMVTGSDPTTIPLAVLVAPILGAFATGFIALTGCAPRNRS